MTLSECLLLNYMEIDKIKQVIVNQKEEIKDMFEQEAIIDREVDFTRLKKVLSQPNILIISGVRRSGKSTLALSVARNEKYVYINFDDDRLAGFIADDFERLLQSFYEIDGKDIDFFVFDEIQNIKNWELFLARLRRTKKIIATGSNAKLLAGELATCLTGRYVDFTLYTFSFTEFLKFKQVSFSQNDFYSTAKIARIKNLLAEYLQVGGFPEALKLGRTMAKKIFDDVVAKDILFRHQLKNIGAFKELANYLLSNFSQTISYVKLKNIFEVKNIHTIRNYLEYLTDSFLILVLEKFSYKLKQQFIAPKKIYCIDSGMINSLAFQFSPNQGRLMENTVFLELLRRNANIESDKEIFYWQDYVGKEVDFIVKQGRQVVQLIQVCQSLSDIATKERELKSLIKASAELKCGNLLIITDDEQGEEKIKDKEIKIISLWRWLLEK